MTQITKNIEISDYQIFQGLNQQNGRFLTDIENRNNTIINIHSHGIEIKGEDEAKVLKSKKLVNDLINLISIDGYLDQQKAEYLLNMAEKGETGIVEELKESIIRNFKGKSIRPKTLGQKRYIKSIEKNHIVFGIGPAGTGKTYLAIAMAVKALKEKNVNKIILTRPAIEAGEKLGFLPGDLQEKVDPYLRPLYDGLNDMLGQEVFQRHMEKGIIEVAPLAYMRGRTLENSFIILDEAQNTTPEQMKMFLTRFGFGSKAVITGDVTQIDLPRDKSSGLKQVEAVLKDIEGLDFIHLTESDVVRHPIVTQIILAYEKSQ